MSSSVLRFPKCKPLKASLPPASASAVTPNDLRALLETFIVERPRELAPLATWFRITLHLPHRRLKRGG